MNEYLVLAIGLLAQILFSARMIVQWVASEKAKKILSPTLFWQLSMVASFMLCVYGWLRDDFAIILGQLIAYYIYIWNLNIKGSWTKIPYMMRVIFIFLPVASTIYFSLEEPNIINHLFAREDLPAWLITFGVLGQFTFTLRFIYQWLYSRRAGESLLPIPFWIISLTGSVMIIIYAILRHDPVLIIGQAFGLVIYIRNVMIGFKSCNTVESDS